MTKIFLQGHAPEFLVPDPAETGKHYHDPYTLSGARSIIRRFGPDVREMLLVMREEREKYTESEGKTMLARSPLKRKIFVAAAMKTMGWIAERPTRNGTCGLILTDLALRQLDGWLALQQERPK